MNTQMVELDKELAENKSKREELQQEKVSPPHHTLKGFLYISTMRLIF